MMEILQLTAKQPELLTTWPRNNQHCPSTSFRVLWTMYLRPLARNATTFSHILNEVGTDHGAAELFEQMPGK
jgi:hypothetical protein